MTTDSGVKILFASGKGGVGKSTLAYLFVITLLRAGKAVAVTDLDPQQSLTAWLRALPLAIKGESDVEIIDSPPRMDDSATLLSMDSAERIIIPCAPSPAEWAIVQQTAGVVDKRKTRSCKSFVVMNKVKKGTLYSKEMEGLSLKLPAAVRMTRSVIADREVYKHALVRGLSALNPAARNEIVNLVMEIH